MEIIYVYIFAVIGIIIAIGVGLEISKDINEFIIYMLFWMLYIITIMTFISIVLVANYYFAMRNKTGPPGIAGREGDRGEKGEAGLCDITCRDSICENKINKMITDKLKEKNPTKIIKMNNVYVKSKIRLMCASDDFKNTMGYNGPKNLINYLEEIWKIWFELLYEAGGNKFFETIGAESDYEWLSTNPFDELKKYDVFYWGMGKQYRPEIIEKCYNSVDGVNPDDSNYVLRISTTNYYDFLGDDSGSRAYNNVSFWRAKQFTYKENVFYPVGDVAIGPSRTNERYSGSKLVGQYRIPNLVQCPERQTIIVSGDIKGPDNYELIWTSQDYVNNNVFWVWRPIPPRNFIALGDIVTFSSAKPPIGNNAPIRCVPKDIAIHMKPNGKTIWASTGSSIQTNILLLGYVPNTGDSTPAKPDNAYNLFRAVIGGNPIIPSSDINGSFYSLDPDKYDLNFSIGGVGDPGVGSNPSKVGKGYLPSRKKDAKYSVMGHLNLKNNASLTHTASRQTIQADLIPNAISNAYLLKIGNKCLDYDNTSLSKKECDELIDTQIFSIIFTGNKKNECKIQHYKSKKNLIFKDNLFTLIDAFDTQNKALTLFTMS